MKNYDGISGSELDSSVPSRLDLVAVAGMVGRDFSRNDVVGVIR